MVYTINTGGLPAPPQIAVALQAIYYHAQRYLILLPVNPTEPTIEPTAKLVKPAIDFETALGILCHGDEDSLFKSYQQCDLTAGNTGAAVTHMPRTQVTPSIDLKSSNK